MDSRLKPILFWCGIVCLCFVGIPFHLKGEERKNLEMAFHNYSQEFKKTESLDKDSMEARLLNFKKSLRMIELLNKQRDNVIKLSKMPNLKSRSGGGESEENFESLKWKPGMAKNVGLAAWGLTAFADMSPEDFEKHYLDKGLSSRIDRREKHRKSNHSGHHRHENHSKTEESNEMARKKRAAVGLPDKVDWRTKNVISPIRHQQACGACWAFSTVETVESMSALKSGQLPILSVQQVINCATNGNLGCNGGDTCSAIQWMTANKLVTEKEYPLTLKDGACHLQSPAGGVSVNSNFTCETYEGYEDGLLSVLAHHGPVAAAVDATNWQYYVGGIIQWNCEANNNHAIQIVGYDKTATPPHYIVRNSWGTDFGDNGYLYVAIGKNLCGIAREVSALSVS